MKRGRWVQRPFNDFNPRAPRGARRIASDEQTRIEKISIHVPREGHDVTNHRPPAFVVISIHVPREGHDFKEYMTDYSDDLFQSTCPARGTTTSAMESLYTGSYFNPRAPRGARLAAAHGTISPQVISIHVPREGHDSHSRTFAAHGAAISIHVPREGHDGLQVRDFVLREISIHVPREGHDTGRDRAAVGG